VASNSRAAPQQSAGWIKVIYILAIFLVLVLIAWLDRIARAQEAAALY
jgi:hypothetical protein